MTWDERYEHAPNLYGTEPNAFLKARANLLAGPSRVTELGAGEGRTALFYASLGHTVTAVDQSAVALRRAEVLAKERGLSLCTKVADVLNWISDEPQDAVLMSFLHLPAPGRVALAEQVRRILRPDGLLMAEWFRPEQRTRKLSSGGPEDAALMPTLEELAVLYPGAWLLEEATPTLNEGTGHVGLAATVRLVWQNGLRAPLGAGRQPGGETH